MSDDDKIGLDYGKSFWSVANGVVVFAIVNTLTYLIAVGPKTGPLASAVALHRTLAGAGIVTATVVYVVLLVFCHRAHRDLVESQITNEKLLRRLKQWNGIQIAAVVVVGLACLPLSLF